MLQSTLVVLCAQVFCIEQVSSSFFEEILELGIISNQLQSPMFSSCSQSTVYAQQKDECPYQLFRIWEPKKSLLPQIFFLVKAENWCLFHMTAKTCFHPLFHNVVTGIFQVTEGFVFKEFEEETLWLKVHLCTSHNFIDSLGWIIFTVDLCDFHNEPAHGETHGFLVDVLQLQQVTQYWNSIRILVTLLSPLGKYMKYPSQLLDSFSREWFLC